MSNDYYKYLTDYNGINRGHEFTSRLIDVKENLVRKGLIDNMNSTNINKSMLKGLNKKNLPILRTSNHDDLVKVLKMINSGG